MPFFALAVGAGDKAAQAGVPALSFGQQSQVVAVLRQSEFAADYCFEAGLLRSLPEARQTVKAVVVAERQRGHIPLGGLRYQRLGGGHAVQQREIGVGV